MIWSIVSEKQYDLRKLMKCPPEVICKAYALFIQLRGSLQFLCHSYQPGLRCCISMSEKVNIRPTTGCHWNASKACLPPHRTSQSRRPKLHCIHYWSARTNNVKGICCRRSSALAGTYLNPLETDIRPFSKRHTTDPWKQASTMKASLLSAVSSFTLALATGSTKLLPWSPPGHGDGMSDFSS